MIYIMPSKFYLGIVYLYDAQRCRVHLDSIHEVYNSNPEISCGPTSHRDRDGCPR